MALVTAIADGDLKVDEATVWDTGAEPAALDDVFFATHDIEITTTTNAIASLAGAAGGGIYGKDGGKLRLAGIADFDNNETFDAEAGFEVPLVCAADNQANVYLRIDSGAIVNIQGTLAKPVKIYGEDSTKRPTQGVYLRTPSQSSSIDGLEIYDCYSYGFHANTALQLPAFKNTWIHDIVSYGLYIDFSVNLKIENLCIYSTDIGMYVRYGAAELENCIFGEDLDGAANANTLRDIELTYSFAVADKIILASTTQTLLAVYGDYLTAANLGAVVSDGIITGKGTPGTHKTFFYEGNIDIQSAVARSGNAARIIPNINCSAIWPVKLAAKEGYSLIPVKNGDIIDASLYASCLAAYGVVDADKPLLRMEGWGTDSISTEKANDGTEDWIQLAVNGTVSGLPAGVIDHVKLWLEVPHYAIGGTVYADDLTIRGSTAVQSDFSQFNQWHGLPIGYLGEAWALAGGSGTGAAYAVFEAIKNLFDSDVGPDSVYTAVGGRYRFIQAEQEEPWPYIVVTFVDGINDWTMDQDFLDMRIQFSIYSKGYGSRFSPEEACSIYGKLTALFDEATLVMANHGSVYCWRDAEALVREDFYWRYHVDYRLRIQECV